MHLTTGQWWMVCVAGLVLREGVGVCSQVFTLEASPLGVLYVALLPFDNGPSFSRSLSCLHSLPGWTLGLLLSESGWGCLCCSGAGVFVCGGGGGCWGASKVMGDVFLVVKWFVACFASVVGAAMQ